MQFFAAEFWGNFGANGASVGPFAAATCPWTSYSRSSASLLRWCAVGRNEAAAICCTPSTRLPPNYGRGNDLRCAQRTLACSSFRPGAGAASGRSRLAMRTRERCRAAREVDGGAKTGPACCSQTKRRQRGGGRVRRRGVGCGAESTRGEGAAAPRQVQGHAAVPGTRAGAAHPPAEGRGVSD